jgi:hypothetical protein
LWTDWMTIFIWIIRYPRKRLGIYYAHYKSYRFNSIVCKQFVIYQKDECLIYVLYYHTKPKSSFWKTFFFLQTAWFNLNQRCIDIFFFSGSARPMLNQIQPKDCCIKINIL